MAFNFSIQDINFDVNFKSETRTETGFSRLNKEGSKYGPNLLTYPIDLGTIDRAHYMMFTIFEQEVTNFKGTPDNVSNMSQGVRDMQTLNTTINGEVVTPNFGGTTKSLTDLGSDLLGDGSYLNNTYQSILSSVGTVINDEVKKSIEGVTSKLTSGINPIKEEFKRTDVSNFNRKLKRINEIVALYLPDTLSFNYNQSYSDVSMYDGNVGLGAVAASAADQIRKINPYQSNQKKAEEVAAIAGKNLSPFISRALSSKLGGAGRVLASTVLGGVENPMLELLYTSPEFRSFQFDFMMYPRSQAEADQVHKIINSFKFHSAPEIKPGSAGYFLVPPSVFNIEFYYNGSINPNLPLLSDCVCTGVSVDYAPSGWAAYEVPGQPTSVGGTGSPFAIRLTLSFKETVILTKGLYQKPNTTSLQRDNR